MSKHDQDFVALKKAAREACSRAYARYSSFPVGAALVDESGRIFSGCNVENASFGLTICAERNAIGAAVAAGARSIARLLVYTPGETAHSPCGACRQVIDEFAQADSVIVSCCDAADVRLWSMQELLPDRFESRWE